MKLPLPRSCEMTILRALRVNGALTIKEGAVAHGHFRNSPFSLQELYDHLVRDGCAILVGDAYIITEEAAQCLAAPPPPPGQIVPPRDIDVMNRPPLDLKRHGFYANSQSARREGSEDYKSWPSHVAKLNP